MRRLLLTLALTLAPAVAQAACPAMPFVFTDGTPVRASQVNANFTALRNCISAAAADSATPPSGVSLHTYFGCIGDGVTDDTACVQAAITWADTSGIPLLLDGTHKYLITSGLISGGSPVIIGQVGVLTIYDNTCPSGFVTNANITLLTATGPTGRIEHLCFEMASTAGTRTLGAGLAVGATLGNQQGHFQVKNNAIINPFNGILIGGNTTGSSQTNGNLVADNVIINPSNIGIGHGLTSTLGSTVGTTVRDNQIYCGAASSAANGIELRDGAIIYYGGDTGPYGCNVGLKIVPGVGQVAGGVFSGVLGDTSQTASLWITPEAGGLANTLRFASGSWAGYATTSSNTDIRMDGGGQIKNTIFDGFFAHSYLNQTTPIFDIQNGFNVTITGSHIVANGGGTTTGAGIRIADNANVQNVVVVGNFIGSHNGVLANGIQLDSTRSTLISGNMFNSTTGVTISGDIFSIVGNDFGQTTTPVSFTPAGETAVITQNLGIDNVCPLVASAAAISVPNVASCVALSGGTTIDDITNSAWSAREVTLVSPVGLILSVAGASGSKFCTTYTLAAGESKKVRYDSTQTCWAPI